MTRRRVIQLISLVCFIALVLIPPGPPSDGQLAHPFLLGDPYLGMVVLLGTGTITLGALAGALLLGVLTSRRGAFFCRNLCPMGTAQDMVPRLRLTVASSAEECQDEPALLRAPRSLFRLQPWLFTVLLVLAVFRLFPATVLDPLTLLAQGILSLQDWAARGQATIAIHFGVGLLLAVFIGCAFRQRRFFCNHFCPLGQTLQLIQIASIPRSGLVVAAHAAQRLGSPTTDGGRRTPGVGLMNALMNRRSLLSAAVVLPLVAMGSRLPASPVLRPPGALPESDFLRTCIRCGQCTASCPTGTIEPCLMEGGLTGFLSPRLTLSRAPCTPVCTACQTACPTGALRVLEPSQRRAWRIGLATVESSACLRTRGKDCRVCRQVCPYNAINYARGGSLVAPTVEPDLCVGCGICEAACPPGKALIVRREVGT